MPRLDGAGVLAAMLTSSRVAAYVTSILRLVALAPTTLGARISSTPSLSCAVTESS